MSDLPEWISTRIVYQSDCWLWQGSLRRGYGRMKIKGRAYGAHRLVYEALVGPIPEGLEIDHLCRVRNCVNPSHLEPVTRQVNHLRGLGRYNRQGQTHCKRGHSLADGHINKRGGRDCRPCRKERNAKRWREQRDSRIV